MLTWICLIGVASLAHDAAARYSMSPAEKENFVDLLERLAAADAGYKADQVSAFCLAL